jgi:hypothetical protein
MLPSRSVWVPPTSGFVPFSPAGVLDDDEVVAPEARVREPAPLAVTRAEPEPVRAVAPFRASVWEPATTRAVRRVEMVVLAGICAYFAFGLGRLLGLL